MASEGQTDRRTNTPVVGESNIRTVGLTRGLEDRQLRRQEDRRKYQAMSSVYLNANKLRNKPLSDFFRIYYVPCSEENETRIMKQVYQLLKEYLL